MAPRKPPCIAPCSLIWMTQFLTSDSAAGRPFPGLPMLSLVQFRGSIHRVSTLRPDAVVSAKGRHLTVEQVIHRRAESMARWFGHPEQKPCLSAALLPVFGGRGCPRTSCAETLSLLHKKVPLYGASNGILAIQQARLEKANLTTYFSGLFVSDKIGAEKPDPRFLPSACSAVVSRRRTC